MGHTLFLGICCGHICLVIFPRSFCQVHILCHTSPKKISLHVRGREERGREGVREERGWGGEGDGGGQRGTEGDKSGEGVDESGGRKASLSQALQTGAVLGPPALSQAVFSSASVFASYTELGDRPEAKDLLWSSLNMRPAPALKVVFTIPQ